jgi:hypothetical protein
VLAAGERQQMSDTGIQRIYRHASTEYTTVPNWVVRDPKYTPNAFRLLAYLLSHADGYELTYSQIERQTTLGRYAINKAAAFLIEQGWLEWKQEQGEGGRWLAKTWIIKDPDKTSPLPNGSGVESFRSGTANGHKEEHLTEKKTNKEKNTNPEVLFEQFWAEYPRKVDRGAALKAFAKALKHASFEEILSGAIGYANDPNRKPEFTKYPASWLNAQSWLNQVTVSDELPKRTERERERTRAIIAETKEAEAKSAPPPKCPHGDNVALCKKCFR